ncbi:aminoglycoside N(3)-acetyltransferase [Actinoplanes sp. NPDC020271]|uniref:aminoglycoside N(3)-acetyltransferase n=1 Tax=Actinoplanes sp. NPDC020271 TaxID=3363896 RepID=UPI00378A4151
MSKFYPVIDTHGTPSQGFPHTVTSLSADLRTLGLAAGHTVLVHSSVRSVGFVAGQVQAIVQALLNVLGQEGTLVVPTHTSFNSDPEHWRNPPVPASWWPTIKSRFPGYDVSRTPSRHMGILPEVVRTWPGARRSDHPQVSFAALGTHAETVTANHSLEDGLGDGSPLGAIYRLNGKVLLIGCGHERNTSMHLAECRQPHPPRSENGAAIRDGDAGSRWVTWIDAIADASDFGLIGAEYETTGAVTIGTVGNATARLMSQPAVVDFATAWIATHRAG